MWSRGEDVIDPRRIGSEICTLVDVERGSISDPVVFERAQGEVESWRSDCHAEMVGNVSWQTNVKIYSRQTSVFGWVIGNPQVRHTLQADHLGSRKVACRVDDLRLDYLVGRGENTCGWYQCGAALSVLCGEVVGTNTLLYDTGLTPAL